MTDNDGQNPIKPEMIFHNPVTRRTMIGGSMAAGLGIFGGAMMRGGAWPLRPAPAGRAIGAQEAEATPAAKQVLTWVRFLVRQGRRLLCLRLPAGGPRLTSPANRSCGWTRNSQIQPAAAESWESTEDGMTWTFKIREGLTWSDGNPVTANDWVATFQSSAPTGVRLGLHLVFPGRAEELDRGGRRRRADRSDRCAPGANDYELVFETLAPAPYLPAMLLYSLPLSAAGLAANGLFYNTDPATAISSGPYILSEWLPDQQITFTRNEAYTGTLPALVDEVRCKLASPDNFFAMYQADEIDYMANPAPAATTIMMGDEATSRGLLRCR